MFSEQITAFICTYTRQRGSMFPNKFPYIKLFCRHWILYNGSMFNSTYRISTGIYGTMDN